MNNLIAAGVRRRSPPGGVNNDNRPSSVVRRVSHRDQNPADWRSMNDNAKNLQPTCNQLATDCISRQAAIDCVTAGARPTTIRGRIAELPSAQPKRKRGKWNITDAYPHNVYCSECYTRFAQTHWAVWEDGSLPRNFCPNCGAWMKGGNS